jgi:hypothetical protein
LSPVEIHPSQSSDVIVEPEPDFLGEARRVVSTAEEGKLILRSLGAAAFRLHCPANLQLHVRMGRELSDLDFAGYSKDRSRIEALLGNDLGYQVHASALAETQGLLPDRTFFYDVRNKRVVDVFFDRLEMCHTIDFKGRLEKDYPTIPLADLLLEKLQIVKLNTKDIKDSVILLMEHPVGDSDKETVNSNYIAQLMARDWGFYHTVTTNLGKIGSYLATVEQLSEDQRSLVSSRIRELTIAIEQHPKTFQWKARARIGTKKKWYNDVEEVVR